ncbi:MAG: hypothetical protein KOO62_00995 [candidate division Zixibacteria bacterium]|nr:hypothetical protein [candidate division Zixibacteria bacterium]
MVICKMSGSPTVCYLFLIVVFILFDQPTVQGFDNKHEGFVLGYGVGAGVFSAGYSADYSSRSDNVDLLGLYTDFKIGAGLSDHVILYYTGKQWFGFDNGGWYNGFPAIGVSYYVNDRSPSLIMLMSVGIPIGLGIEEVGIGSADGVSSGININLGLGYEVKHSVGFELNFSRNVGCLNDVINLKADHDSWQLAVSLNYLEY